MRTFSGKRSTLALAIAGVTAMSGFMAMPEARAEGFIDDSTLTGGIYYWQRERDRKDVTDGDKYKTNLSHSTWNANLDFQSGYAADMFGLDIAAFTAIEMAENGDSSHPNEIAFSKSNKAYDEDWSGDNKKSGLYEDGVRKDRLDNNDMIDQLEARIRAKASQLDEARRIDVQQVEK